MNVQRLSIRAPAGRLRIISVWRSLSQSGARVCGWAVKVDAATGNECMTVDVTGCDEQSLARLTAKLGGSPLDTTETTVTACSLSSSDGIVADEE